MKILNITNTIPYPLLSGAPLRTYNLLRRFAKDHETYLAAFSSTNELEKEASQELKFCRAIVSTRRKKRNLLALLLGLLKWPFEGGPLELRLSFSKELARNIQNLTQRIDFDVVLLEHGCMGLYLETLPLGLQKRAVWVLHDIDFDKFRRISRVEKNLPTKGRTMIHSMMMKLWQPKFAEKFGLCVTMSDIDRRLLMAANKRLRIEISPNGVDTQLYRPIPENNGIPALLFMGNMSYGPNIDAVTYFYEEIFPLIRREIAGVEFWIVGIDPVESVIKLAGDGVFVTGKVADILPYYERSTACVVPLRAGSGTRLKILEAMALGRPVVSTRIGAEGLDVADGRHIAIADDSIGFAQKTIELLKNSELRKKLIAQARWHVVASYDWDVVAKNFLSLLEEMALRARLDRAQIQITERS